MSSYFPDRSQDGFGPYPPAAPPKFNGHIMQETGGNHVSSYFPDLSLDGSGPYPPANRQHLHPKPPAVNIHALIPVHGAAPLPHKLAHSKIPFKTFGAHKHALHPAPPLPPYHAPPKPGPRGPPHQTHYHVHSLAPSQMYYMAKSKPIPMEMMHMLPFDQKVVNMDLLTGLTHGAKGLLGVLVNGISSATNLVHGASTKLLGGVATGSQLLQTVIETVKDRLGAKMMMPGDMAAGMQAAAAGPYPPARPGAPVYGPPHH